MAPTDGGVPRTCAVTHGRDFRDTGDGLIRRAAVADHLALRALRADLGCTLENAACRTRRTLAGVVPARIERERERRSVSGVVRQSGAPEFDLETTRASAVLSL